MVLLGVVTGRAMGEDNDSSDGVGAGRDRSASMVEQLGVAAAKAAAKADRLGANAAEVAVEWREVPRDRFVAYG
jgi:hypothetical protein